MGNEIRIAAPTSRNKHLYDMYRELGWIAGEEFTRLCRLKRRMEAHGVSKKLCSEVMEEAWQLHKMAPEQLLCPFTGFKYAFR